MTKLRRSLIIITGIIILLVSYLYVRDAEGAGLQSVILNPGLYGLIVGAALTIFGALRGVHFSKRSNYILGGIMVVCGYYLVYGGIDIISSGVEMRDVLFSPGIALMGAGLFIIAKTWRGGRL